ncbi:hypothetical protein LCGC14_2855240, partial [marine sediment metagenome]
MNKTADTNFENRFASGSAGKNLRTPRRRLTGEEHRKLARKYRRKR